MNKKSKLFVITAMLLLVGCSSGNSLSSSEKPSETTSFTSNVGTSSTLSSSLDSSSEEESTSSIESSSFSSFTSSSSSISEEIFYEVIVINGTGSNNHVTEGDLVTVVADSEEEGKKFVGWEDENGNLVSTNKTYTFSCTRNVTLTAVYETIKFNLTVTGGSGSGTYEYGSKVSVTATIKESEEFVAWVDENENVISTDNPYIFEIKSDLSLICKIELKVLDGELTKEQLETYIQGDWLGGGTTSSSAFNVNFAQDKSFTLIDNKRAVNKISCTGTWEVTTTLDKELTHVGKDTSATDEYLVVSINNLVIETGDKYTEYLAIHFAIAKDGSSFLLHYQAPSSQSTSQLIDLVKQ